MKTTIVNRVYDRDGYLRNSLYAKRAEKLTWRAERITFSGHSPCANPAADGWTLVYTTKKQISDTNRDYSLLELSQLECKEIWYKVATLYGGHRIYVK